MGFDMHVHSTVSDGVFPPEYLVDWAQKLGLEGMALTDHDTVFGVEQALEVGKAKGFTVIPGIELSCEYEHPAHGTSHEVHILGYFVNQQDEDFLATLRYLQECRMNRAKKILAILRENGILLDEAILIEYKDQGAIGRAVVAREMVKAGYVKDMDEAFDRWLYKGQRAYVPRAKVKPTEAVEILHKAGGVAVMAHPFLAGIDDQIGALAAAGLDGLEVYHPNHDAAASRKYLALAKRYELVPTGGSDCHNGHLGSHTTLAENVEKLWRRRKSLVAKRGEKLENKK